MVMEVIGRWQRFGGGNGCEEREKMKGKEKIIWSITLSFELHACCHVSNVGLIGILKLEFKCSIRTSFS